MIRKYFDKKLIAMALGVIDCSYWICLLICMLAIILYVSGLKKAGKYASVSFVVYVLLQCCKVGLK